MLMLIPVFGSVRPNPTSFLCQLGCPGSKQDSLARSASWASVDAGRCNILLATGVKMVRWLIHRCLSNFIYEIYIYLYSVQNALLEGDTLL